MKKILILIILFICLKTVAQQRIKTSHTKDMQKVKLDSLKTEKSILYLSHEQNHVKKDTTR